MAAADDNLVRLEGGLQFRNDVVDVAAPLLLAESLKRRVADQIFVRLPFLVGQVRQLHRFEHAVDDECGAEACSQAEKEHASTFVTAKCLHRGLLDDPDWMA